MAAAQNVSVATVLMDARSLVTRLHDSDKITDRLLSQAQGLNERINSMKQYQEELQHLSDISQQRPRSHLVHSLQKENRHIRVLEAENRQLRLSLQDHQAAMELIMAKYRQHMLKFMRLKNVEQRLAIDTVGAFKVDSNDANARFRELASVFSECLLQGEEQSNRDQEQLVCLRSENKVLRDLLRISEQNNPGIRKQFAQRMTDMLHKTNDADQCDLSSSAFGDEVQSQMTDSVIRNVSSSALNASSPSEAGAIVMNGCEYDHPSIAAVSSASKDDGLNHNNNNNVVADGEKGGIRAKATMPQASKTVTQSVANGSSAAPRRGSGSSGGSAQTGKLTVVNNAAKKPDTRPSPAAKTASVVKSAESPTSGRANIARSASLPKSNTVTNKA